MGTVSLSTRGNPVLGSHWVMQRTWQLSLFDNSIGIHSDSGTFKWWCLCGRTQKDIFHANPLWLFECLRMWLPTSFPCLDNNIFSFPKYYPNANELRKAKTLEKRAISSRLDFSREVAYPVIEGHTQCANFIFSSDTSDLFSWILI